MPVSRELEPAILGGELFGGGDGVAMQLRGKLGLAIVASAVKYGHRDAILDEGT